MSKRERVAMAIYHASFTPANANEAQRKIPSPGWCWEKTSEQQREFCLHQADAAISAIDEEVLKR